MGGKKPVDHYANLGIARDATPDQIKRAWRELQTLWHPDKHQGLPEHFVNVAEEILKNINAAKEVLLDPEKRAELDQLLHESGRGSAPAKPAFVPELIDFGRIKAGETRRVRLDIQNLGGPPINHPEQDSSPDSAWFDVALAAPSDSDRFWFGLEVTVTNNANACATVAGQKTGWISVSVDGATTRATVSAFFEQRPDKPTSAPIGDAKSVGLGAAAGSGTASGVRPAGTPGIGPGDAGVGSRGPVPGSGPRWGMIGAALGLVVLLAMFGAFDRKARPVVGLWPGQANASRLAKPPEQLIEINKCLLYKCGGDRWRATQDIAVYANPDMASSKITAIDAGTVFKPIDAAWVTIKPNIKRLRARVEVSINPTYSLEPGDVIYEYASWEGGCVTGWTKGYLGVLCPRADESAFESVQGGVAFLWYKTLARGGHEGWIRYRGDVGWIRTGDSPTFESVQ